MPVNTTKLCDFKCNYEIISSGRCVCYKFGLLNPNEPKAKKKELPFTFLSMPGRPSQAIKNSYFYIHLGRINKHMAEFNKTYEWKVKMIEHLISICGSPKRLTFWQKLFNPFF